MTKTTIPLKSKESKESKMAKMVKEAKEVKEVKVKEPAPIVELPRPQKRQSEANQIIIQLLMLLLN